MDLWIRCLSLCLSLRFGNCLSGLGYEVKWVCGHIYGTKLDTASSVASTSGCAAVCEMGERCISALYNPASGKCETNSERSVFVGNTGVCTPVFKYLAVPKAPYPCATNTDCHRYSSISDCADGFCQCPNGYSLIPSNGTCTTNCTTYGNTFRLFTSMFLSGFNNRGLNYVSFADCKAACIAASDFTCRTFEMNVVLEDECQMSTETVYRQPQAVDGSDQEWSLAQRNCA